MLYYDMSNKMCELTHLLSDWFYSALPVKNIIKLVPIKPRGHGKSLDRLVKAYLAALIPLSLKKCQYIG